MKIAIIQYEDRPVSTLGPMVHFVRRNQAYAARQGYDYHGLSTADVDLPPYWLKPVLCQRALERGYDAALWLDSDAVVHDLDARIESLIAGDEAMVAASDIPTWESPFNAGVFLARGPRGAEILQRWAGLFEPDRWARRDGAWACDETWAGDAFEQGAFVRSLQPELVASGALRMVDWRRLQSPLPLPQSFTLHFPRMYAINMPVYAAHLAAETP